jgi:hypothetical protein
MRELLEHRHLDIGTTTEPTPRLNKDSSIWIPSPKP